MVLGGSLTCRLSLSRVPGVVNTTKYYRSKVGAIILPLPLRTKELSTETLHPWAVALKTEITAHKEEL